jgi:hypothetical protein
VVIDTGQVYFFEPHEFERDHVQWWQHLSPRLLILLDSFRFQWGKPVRVSGHKHAVGRHLGESFSQHNFDRWDEVRAVDVQPDGMVTRDDAYRAVLLAQSVGFTGIGLYPHWSGGPGLHLDVRHERAPGHAVTWGGVRAASGQVYVSLNDALEVLT